MGRPLGSTNKKTGKAALFETNHTKTKAPNNVGDMYPKKATKKAASKALDSVADAGDGKESTLSERLSKSPQKATEFDALMTSIRTKHGKGAIMEQDDKALAIKRLSSGNPVVDLILGGGWPYGRIVEIYGPESGGKTTLTLHAIAEVQKAGGRALFIDVEHALDTNYAEALGVDLDSLPISQPETGEEALDICEMAVKSGVIDLVVVDSVAALVTKKELEGDIGDQHVGLQARLMSQACRKITGALAKSHCIVMFINQLREKVGVMFGSPETTSGGRALKFYASIRVDVRKIEQVKRSETIVGHLAKIKCVKNKTAPPFRSCNVQLLSTGNGEKSPGFDQYTALIDAAVDAGIVTKNKASYSLGKEHLGNGVWNVRKELMQDAKLYNQLVKALQND